MTDTNESLCDFVRRCYPLPGLEPVLLRLQDAHGLDVLMLLTACWLGSVRQPLAHTDWTTLHQTQSVWHQQVIQPLRQARRGLKSLADTSSFYAEIKALEQALEWHCLEQLQAACRIQLQDDSRDSRVLEHLIACCQTGNTPLSGELRSGLQQLSAWMERNARS
ncbi:MAG: TIGR02444 family protein [Gammaproteobacteria bacterium HGW-Gammaproteobacteria-11]|nr:MAG: TIGR02444 family protein [Gammaproteobacteria bacterium HGW-Gammaproteobacteria-11]